METFILTQKSAKKLSQTVMIGENFLNIALRARTQITDVEEMIARLNWQWTGHIALQDTGRRTSKRQKGVSVDRRKDG